MARTPKSIDKAFLKKMVKQYFSERSRYEEHTVKEQGIRPAFQNLLASVARHIDWTFIAEMSIGQIQPDGTIIDELELSRGHWEAKGPKTNLEMEYIVRLVGRVVTVSVETVRLVEELGRGVEEEDFWGI